MSLRKILDAINFEGSVAFPRWIFVSRELRRDGVPEVEKSAVLSVLVVVGRFHWRYCSASLVVRCFWRFGARVLTGSNNIAAPARSLAIAQSREIPARLSSKRIRTRRRRRPSYPVDWSSPQVTPPLCATRHEPIIGKDSDCELLQDKKWKMISRKRRTKNYVFWYHFWNVVLSFPWERFSTSGKI